MDSVGSSSIALRPMVAALLVASPPSPRHGGRLSVRAGAMAGKISSAALVFAHDELWQVCVIGLLLDAGYGLAFAAFGRANAGCCDLFETDSERHVREVWGLGHRRFLLATRFGLDRLTCLLPDESTAL
ncbi:hypothetical protein [Nocardia arthritidis]|uniref:hypothetical protein n=1 Tax=Nocardia arthritidis TaxID=228602 RepID=UPI000A6E3B39|nr:hypothetical protein [Nocardia arthritidis]